LDHKFSQEAKLFYDQGLVIAQRQKRPDLTAYYILRAIKDHPETEAILHAAELDWGAFSTAFENLHQKYSNLFPAAAYDQQKDIRNTATTWARLKQMDEAGVQDLFLACCHAIAPSLDRQQELSMLDEVICDIYDKSLEAMKGSKTYRHIFIPEIENLDSVDKRIPAPEEDGPEAVAERTEAEEMADNLVLSKADHQALTKYCAYMNTQDFYPFSGREYLLDRLGDAMRQIRKKNVMILGEEGVGKTALVEGFVRGVMQGKYWPSDRPVPDFYNLDFTRLVAGAKYHGDVEERVKEIVDIAAKYPGQCILFFDEAHKMVTAGGSGSMDIANILKPALSRGILSVIGATTLDEYRKYIEKDGGLARRFVKVFAEEPNREETLSILRDATTDIVTGHNVLYPRAVMEAAYDMAKRYLPELHMPDIAIDILDAAGVKARKRAGVSAERAKVLKKDVALVVSEKSGVPVASITDDYVTKALYLEDFLKQDVIAQEHAIQILADAVRVSLAELRSDRKTQGAFLFSGPTGVGKTELGRSLAQHTGRELIRVDMSEYMEKHNVSRFIGPPPGYVGYRDGNTIAEKVRRKPYAVLLLDEIEKAHPDVFNILLQVLDNGSFKDGEGHTVDCRNIMVIMTTNAGERERKRGGIGFNKPEIDESAPEAAIKRIFSPEMRNRFDAIVPFHELTDAQLAVIADLALNRFADEQKNLRDLTLEFTEKAKVAVAKNGTNREFGARPLERYIQSQIKTPMAFPILKGTIKNGDRVIIDFNAAGRFVFGEPGNDDEVAVSSSQQQRVLAPGRELH
jgi:ATP-dependent Clp protease ATP-binding subunit ClpA